ncbi:MAG: isoleucine--tRNA ligase [Myxococcales bacterium]|nr:isoleucine--tRNA ligase [Myxococcales bacterium]
MNQLSPLDNQKSFPELEERVIKLWKESNAFKRSVEQRSESEQFIFYDGPPFATGLPHYGHLVASTIKDIVPRYWAMRGYRVERRFGWDTHGLPIEMEMEKTLGLSGPTSIMEYGVDKFNEACRSNVLRYTEEWEQVVGRLGRWVDFDNDYKTMDLPFMESVWWVFKTLWEKGLIYQDFRVMPFSWRLSTALSNFEANLDYRDVQDPAVTVRMPLVDEDASLLIWTTTPWTLPSNLAVAVGTDLDYVKAKRAEGDPDQQAYYLAEALVSKVLGEGAQIIERIKGSALVGKQYVPLFDYFADRALLPMGEGKCFIVIGGDHVTTSDGTGIVHMAPDFGEDDFNACRELGIELVQSVDDEGRFKKNIIGLQGKNIKESDNEIIAFIKQMGRLYRRDSIKHSYPYCWRSGTPLIYKAVPSWFVKVESLRDRMSEHNDSIHWVPDMVGSKRFGNWVKDARDWNISRNRFWGTPIPVWHCKSCGTNHCVGSVEELETLSGEQVTDLHPHKIDHLTLTCPSCQGGMNRISAVFDCWFESGSMPYAQNHYPFEDKEGFESRFPAQFIAEGLDQTRGWFYTLLVLSTALFDRPPFKNVIVNGMVLAEDGSKMSKSKKNYPPPQNILNSHGADALRAYLINSPIVRAEPLRFSEDGVKEVARTVLIPLRNSWSFFTMYANIDGWTPSILSEGQWALADGTLIPTPSFDERADLDRWLISTLQSLVAEVNEQMEGYYLYKVIPPIVAFIDDLTNWYIRRSRRRFWRSADTHTEQVDKASAYATLYEVLVTFSKVMAPVLPFMTESIYQHLVVEAGVAKEGQESIHLCDYPTVDRSKIKLDLEKEITLVRQTVRMGRALRATHNLKTRQPLKAMTVVHPEQEVLAALQRQESLLLEELNLKEVILVTHDQELSSLSFKANFKTLGRRLGKRMKEAAQAIQTFTREEWNILQSGNTIEIAGEAISADDILVTHHAKEGVVLEVEEALTVALDTQLDEALLCEGYAREVISRCQKMRKSAGLEISDRVHLVVCVDPGPLADALSTFAQEIESELLATSAETKALNAGSDLLESFTGDSNSLSTAEEINFGEMLCVAGLKKAE